MILDGSTVKSIKHARNMAAHLVKAENELCQIIETPSGGRRPEDLRKELIDLQALTDLTRGKTGFLHVSIDPRVTDQMKAEHWNRSVSAIEKEFGLENQPRILVYHEKEGRPHVHALWSTVDIDHNKLITLSHYKRRLQKVRLELEREFGHEHAPTRSGDRTFEITPKEREMLKETETKPLDIKKLITQIWEQSKGQKEFLKNMKSNGYHVVQGDRSKFAVLTPGGKVMNLVRQLPKGVKTKDVAKILEQDKLLTVDQVREQIKAEKEQRLNSTAREKTVEKDLYEQLLDNSQEISGTERRDGSPIYYEFKDQAPDITKDEEEELKKKRGRSGPRYER